MARPRGRNVTDILQTSMPGDARVTDELFPLVYDELRRLALQKLAADRPGQTLQPTELVHEAYLRLVEDPDLRWENRAHFFAAAARVMRQILVDRARRRQALKRGGKRLRVNLEEVDLASSEPPAELILGLHEALERLERVDPRQARVVLLRYFAGLTIEETARSLGLSEATVSDEWKFAAAWLGREMTRDDPPRA